MLQVKYLLLRNELLPEGLASHLVASTLAGLAVATTTNPVSAAEQQTLSAQLPAVVCALLQELLHAGCVHNQQEGVVHFTILQLHVCCLSH